jgi:alpha-N-acetylglucosaminidase
LTDCFGFTELAPWHGHFPVGTFFLSTGGVAGDLFQNISEKFIERQAAALGVDSWAAPHYYLADAYNEMPPPNTDPTFLGSVSRSMFEGMAGADSDALMVTQGWFLSGVPRMPWGVAQAKAFLQGPPQGKLLVLDLNAIENPVWNRTESFYGVPFALCMLHNFGERPGLFGRLPQLAAAPPAALRDSVPGTMVGLGMTPEGKFTSNILF